MFQWIAQIDREATIPEEVLDGLKELGLFGLQIPEEYCKIIKLASDSFFQTFSNFSVIQLLGHLYQNSAMIISGCEEQNKINLSLIRPCRA